MNENNQSHEKETKHITLGSSIAWIVGLFLSIGGLAMLFTKPLAGILILIAGLIALPIVNTEIRKQLNISLSGALRTVLVIILCIVSGVLMNNQTPTSQPVTQSVPPAPDTTAVVANPAPTPAVTATVAHAVSKPATPPAVKAVPTPAPAPSTTPVSTETVSQRNAVKKAMDYLAYSAFSHDGLVAQLEYDQFSQTDATYGADNSGGDWNKEAAQKAKEYMSYSAFSHDGLVAQLEYDKFTQEQAEYGANAVGL